MPPHHGPAPPAATLTADGPPSYRYVVGSLQLSPPVPQYFKPPTFSFPNTEGAGQWYSGLVFGKRGSINNGWYGPPWGSDCPTGCPDALSAGLLDIDDLDTRYWTYRLEWLPGPDGSLKWFYDGEFVWAIDLTIVHDIADVRSVRIVYLPARRPGHAGVRGSGDGFLVLHSFVFYYCIHHLALRWLKTVGNTLLSKDKLHTWSIGLV